MSVCVVTNRVPVAKGWEDAFEERFRNRAGLIDKEPGFLRNEIHRPRPMKMDMAAGGLVPDDDKQGYYLIKTWWRDFDDFVAWTGSESFAEAHRNPAPKEMFAGANEIEVHEVFSSTDLDAT